MFQPSLSLPAKGSDENALAKSDTRMVLPTDKETLLIKIETLKNWQPEKDEFKGFFLRFTGQNFRLEEKQIASLSEKEIETLIGLLIEMNSKTFWRYSWLLLIPVLGWIVFVEYFFDFRKFKRLRKQLKTALGEEYVLSCLSLNNLAKAE